MKHTVTSTSATTAQLTVSVTADELKQVKIETLRRLGKDVKAAGFRPGKAPADVVEKHLDTNYLQSQVLEDAVNRFYITAAMEAEIQPIDRPQVEISAFEPDEKLEFVATVEVLPEVTLGDYKKIRKTLEAPSAATKEVTEVIERLRRNSAKKEIVERAAKDDDEVLIDFAGKDGEGKDVPGATGKDYPLTLGSKSFIPGFEEALIGVKPGETKEFAVTFPKDYGHAPLANQKVTFTVTVKSVKELQMPALDDAFAKEVGPFETLADLKKDIKAELQQQKSYEATNKLKNEIIDDLVASSKVELPKSLVEDQEKSVRQDLVQNLAYRGMTLADFLKEQKQTEEEWVKAEVTPQAERRVKVGLILSQVAKQEAIETPEAEVIARRDEMKQQYQNPQMRGQLDSPEAFNDIASRLKTEKTINRLFEISTTK